MDKIDIKNSKLAIQIRNKLHLEMPDASTFTQFTVEELSQVKDLEIENTWVDGELLEKYFPNLKVFVIKSASSKEIDTTLGNGTAVERYHFLRTGLQDFSFVGKLKNLEILEIKNEEHLETLDLRGLSHLSSLTLYGNNHLTSIQGLSDLTSLKELTLVHNARFNQVLNLPQMIEQSLSSLHLDFDLYPLLKKEYPEIDELITNASKEAGFTCDWQENLSDISTNKITTFQMMKMEEKAEQIRDTFIGPNYSDMEKVSSIYTYIVNFVKYDEEALKAARDGENNQALKRAREDHSRSVSTILNRRQSSYNAILENRAVCEGYCNMMHYLLKSVGVPSLVVHCSSDLSQDYIGKNSTHGVIKVKIKGNWFYFDPTWDAKNFQISNFMKTKEEFSKNHVLSMSEEDVVTPSQKPYRREEIQEILDKVLKDVKSGKNKRENAQRKLEKEQKKMEEHESSQQAQDDFSNFFQKKYGSDTVQSDMEVLDEDFKEKSHAEQEHLDKSERRFR